MPGTSSKAALGGSKRKAAAGTAAGAGAPGASGSKSKKSKSSSANNSNDDASIPLGKALASTEKRIRDGAVRSLTAYLSANGAHTIPDLELQKLWKGLFYCFWMSDKPLIQQRLANDLANLVLVHPTTITASSSASASASTSSSSKAVSANEPSERALGGLKFLETFWDTLVAEWAGLDKHRIDKYYLLVRRFVAAGFRLLAEEQWHPAAVARFQAILGKFEGGVLSTNNPRVPDSLTYHLCDMYLDELEKVLEAVHDAANENAAAEVDEEKEEEVEEDLPLVPTMELLLPFVDALATAKSKAMYERIWSNVFDPLLQDTLRASARDGDDELSELGSDASDASYDHDEAVDDADDAEEDQDDEEGGDETANGTEFHSFANEDDLSADSDSEPSLPDSDDENDDDDGETDVRYPLLLALSAVPLPATTKRDVEDEDDEPNADDVDVALVLRKAIFQALFTAASRKDATEARRRLLYQLWRDEQDRLNDLHDEHEHEHDDEDDDEEDDDEEE